MNLAPDLPRLRATLGDARLARLVALLHHRMEQGAPLTGVATLTTATAAERAAVDELLGRRPTSGATLTVDLDAVADALRAAGICEDLERGMAALHGPIPNRRAANLELEAGWAAVWSEAQRSFAARPVLLPWLDELARTGVVKRLTGDEPDDAMVLLREVAHIAAALPAAAEPLPLFAACLLGDAHALDPGSPLATLAVRAAACLGGMAFEDNAEGRRVAWASAGVMCDELSTPALVLNLPAAADSTLGRLLRSAGGDGEPVHVSLRLLLRHPLRADSGLRAREVFVCENPTIVALAAARLGCGCAPLVCINGQIATPALVLLRQLRDAGARLRYHGDFDPPGLAIARRVFDECGAMPWRFDEADYLEAPKGVRFTGKVGATPWSLALAGVMRKERRAVHEEAVFDKLAEDLGREP